MKEIREAKKRLGTVGRSREKEREGRKRHEREREGKPVE